MNIERHRSSESKNDGKVIDESAYVNACVDYALKTGWVKPEQKDILINGYLLPIYHKYDEIINEIKGEIATEPNAEETLKTITRRLGHILDRTRRIGSTDPDNIRHSIYDYRDMFCQSDMYLEYAITSLADFISELLYSKN